MNVRLRVVSLLPFIALMGACEARAPSAQPPDAAAAAPAPKAPRAPTGTVTGRVIFDGVFAPPARLPTNASVARQCGTEVDDRSLVVSADGGVGFAVASVDDAPFDEASGVGAPEPLVVDQKGCAFSPVTFGARAGGVLTMKNSDPLTHNVRAQKEGHDLYNVAMPLEGMTVKKTLPNAPGLVTLHCDIHPWMNARIKTFAHPYFATADEAGHFTLKDVPAGAHTVTIWHPRLGEKSARVDVVAGKEAAVDIHVGPKDVRPLE